MAAIKKQEVKKPVSTRQEKEEGKRKTAPIGAVFHLPPITFTCIRLDNVLINNILYLWNNR